MLYDYFIEVWELRTRHMVNDLPSQYVFQLLLCYQKGCPHQKPSTAGMKEDLLYLTFHFLFLTVKDHGEAQIVQHVLNTAVVTT